MPINLPLGGGSSYREPPGILASAVLLLPRGSRELAHRDEGSFLRANPVEARLTTPFRTAVDQVAQILDDLGLDQMNRLFEADLQRVDRDGRDPCPLLVATAVPLRIDRPEGFPEALLDDCAELALGVPSGKGISRDGDLEAAVAVIVFRRPYAHNDTAGIVLHFWSFLRGWTGTDELIVKSNKLSVNNM